MQGEPVLQEVGDSAFAYLQQGSWGYSNAGLIRGHGASLLVDTLYDLKLTRQMLTMMMPITHRATIETVVNTHANGDHCWGNQEVAQARIISSKATAEEMGELSPATMHLLVRVSRLLTRSRPARKAMHWLGQQGLAPAKNLADAAELVVNAFGTFDFGPIRLRTPDTTFEGTLEIEVGGQRVQLIEVGPAHTRGDAIVYLPEQKVLYTGDILFMRSHPVLWAGPVENWIAACDRILALDVDVVVPGHGPLTDKQGVHTMRKYWVDLLAEAKRGHAAGLDANSLAYELLPNYEWSESERLVLNLEALYRQLDQNPVLPHPLAQLGCMGRFLHAPCATHSAT